MSRMVSFDWRSRMLTLIRRTLATHMAKSSRYTHYGRQQNSNFRVFSIYFSGGPPFRIRLI